MGDGWYGGNLSVLVLGLIFGVQHAFEADHVAAVSSIVASEDSKKKIALHGFTWGLGHTLTLLVLAGGALIFGLAIGSGLDAWLESAVGVMLIGLGTHTIVVLIRNRVHAHHHSHGDGISHVHFHSHRGENRPHNRQHHEHHHPGALPLRTFLVGMVHGVAGTAALFVLAIAAVDSALLGLCYILLFGVGSVLGMAAMSTAIALPLTWTARRFNQANRTLQFTVGFATIAIGAYVIGESLTS